MKQDTGKFRTQTVDKFYTSSDVAHTCITTFIQMYPDSVEDINSYCWVEPSAGSGAFSTQFPPSVRKICMDI